MSETTTTRTEHDLLGDIEVPADAYYGAQTLRARENFRITETPISHYPALVRALAMVKQAAARTNHELGKLERDKTVAIDAACQEIIDGEHHKEFCIDVIQGGAGTSTNMNANEVIANRGLELMGYAKGDYDHLHPNNDVNLGQSTNDVYPTAVRLAIYLSYPSLKSAMEGLIEALDSKSSEYSNVLKMGRTQMQDAVPMTLGQEFHGWSTTISEDVQRLHRTATIFREINLGATAIGTGITTDARYAQRVTEKLAAISDVDLMLSTDLVEATSDTGAFVTFSGVLKRISVKISKICNDLRLLSSGPRAGLHEINLPTVQPGSSIMPGKVNPVIPEVVNQVAFEVIGNDLSVSFAAEAGQLQLNAFEPVIAFNVLRSMRMLTHAMETLTDKCIQGIEVNQEVLERYVDTSIGTVTALVPVIGYAHATRIAEKALETGRGIRDLVLEAELVAPERLEELLSPERMTKPMAVPDEPDTAVTPTSETRRIEADEVDGF